MTNRSPLPVSLAELAAHCGIVTQFHDIDGRLHQLSVEGLLALLERLGVSVRTPEHASDALRMAQAERARRLIEPVTVSWAPQPSRIAVAWAQTPRASHVEARVDLDQGGCLSFNLPLGAPHADALGRVTTVVELPELPPGRHRVTLDAEGNELVTWLLRAPHDAWPAKPPCYGVFAPTYALRATAESTGTFSDLAALASWGHRHGAGFIGTLPLLPIYLSEPFDPSPYAPVSRLLWNDLYLDLAQLAEQQQCRTVLPLLAEYQQVHRVQTRSRERLIDYRPVAERHRRALLELSRQFFGSASPEREQLAVFVRENPKLERYARFRAVMARHGGHFRQWPAAWRADLSGTDDFDPAERDLHLYAQWRAHQQVTTLADAARDRDCGLYLDLPIGTHSNGYDAWYHDRSFLPNASAGAPPDPFFSKGQNWGFAPLHPERVREDGYAYVQACLQHHMRVAEILRIDHVMGLHRIYCIPNGMAGSDGAYLSYRADELYALVALESHRHRCSVVGEDLGTVPPEVREAMTRHGLLRMYVAQFSLREARPALELPSEHSLASLNTHDMPPFAAFVRGLDIDDRVALGALHAEQATAGKQARERLIQALRDELGCSPGDDALLLQRLLERLAQSPAPYVLASLEDLWLEAAAQNVPGTQFERPNWRRRMAHALDTLDSQADIMAALAALARPQQAGAGSSLHREPSSA